MDDDHSKKPREGAGSFLSRLLPQSRPDSPVALAGIIRDAAGREVISSHTESMLHGALKIARLRLDDLMTPRQAIVSIDLNCTLAQAAAIVAEHGHSRYPVIAGDKDHVAGILMAKDLLPYGYGIRKDVPLKELLRPAVIVPESKRADAMLKEFQNNRFHMAVVVDEFGGVSGLITIEDILELIVGEINDEYDLEESNASIAPLTDDAFVVQGDTPLDEFEERFAARLPRVGMDTVAGVVLHFLGHFPAVGEQLQLGQFSFTVREATPSQIISLQVRPVPA